MATDSIIRAPTNEEKKDFTPIVDPGKHSKSVEEQFREKLGEEMAKAVKNRLPFADKAARDDFKEGYDIQIKRSMKKHGGFVDASEIEPVNIDWNKYSDLNNFELVEEGETADDHLTNKNPGLDVTVGYKRYRFKGYINEYMITEDKSEAIRRARKKVKELEA